MNTREKAGLIVIAVLLIAGVVGVVSYVQEREDRIRTQERSNGRQEKQAELDRLRSERDKETARQVEDLKDQARKVRTVPQALQALPQVVELPSPIVERSNPDMPDAQSEVVIPKESVVPLYQHLATCKQDALLLGTCQANEVTLKNEVKLVEQDRDDWKTTAKGGSKWQRTKRGLKWLGIGVAIGAGALCGTGHCK